MPGRGALSKEPKKENTFSLYGNLNKETLKTKVQLHLLQMKLAKSRERNVILSNKSVLSE